MGARCSYADGEVWIYHQVTFIMIKSVVTDNVQFSVVLLHPFLWRNKQTSSSSFISQW